MTTRELLLVFAPLLALACTACVQAGHYRLRGSLVGSYLAALLTGSLASIGFSLALAGGDSVESLGVGLVHLGAFWGLWLCFVAVVGLSVSLRMRILSFLRAARRPLPEAEIEARFEGSKLVSRRLERLVAGGHVRVEQGRLVSTGSWLTRVALLNASIKHFLTGRASEFATAEPATRKPGGGCP